MIERTCPTCWGKASTVVFRNELGQVAKLWKCEQCEAIWGVPTWDFVARENKYDFGLEPWVEDDVVKKSHVKSKLEIRSSGCLAHQLCNQSTHRQP